MMFKVFECNGGISIQAPYHNRFISRAKMLGGSYANGRWSFVDSVKREAFQLAQRCYGEGDPDAVGTYTTIRIRALRDIVGHQDAIYFNHRVIAAARGRDSGATVGHNVRLIDGRVGSSGSFKNWLTTVSADSVFEIGNFPLSDAEGTAAFEVISINDAAVIDRKNLLLQRKADLLAQVADIDEELGDLGCN